MLFNFEKFRNKTALIDWDNEKYSYRQISSKIKHINSKIEKRSLILIIGDNSVQAIIGYLSFIKSNNVSILLDRSFKTIYINEIVKKYKPNYIFCPKNYLIKKEKNYKVLTFKDYVLIRTNFKKHTKINGQNLLLLSTSGTTQSPKFVRLSNKNLIHNTKSIIKYLNINSKHTTITTMPMAYSYGLSIINTHLLAGSKIILTKKTVFDKDFWNIVKKHKVTSFGGVPQFYEQLKKLKFENLNLPNLKYLTQAGGKLNNTDLKYFEEICRKKKIKFIVMYGQTEASPRMSYLKWNKFSSKLGSIGKGLKGSKFKLIDEKDKDIARSFIVGELIYYGKNVCLGYSYFLRDLYDGDINKGKLYTGDLGYKDKDNFFYITGRKNRMSKIFGIRIDLDDIENKLKKNRYRVQCVPDNKYLKILIVEDYNVDKIRQFIYDSYGINKNFILISKVKHFTNAINFKNVSKI